MPRRAAYQPIVTGARASSGGHCEAGSHSVRSVGFSATPLSRRPQHGKRLADKEFLAVASGYRKIIEFIQQFGPSSASGSAKSVTIPANNNATEPQA